MKMDLKDDKVLSSSDDASSNITDEKGKDVKVNELLFLGTFYHDSGEEVHIDLIQFRGPVQITEIRVIPLGAEVKLSNDSFQLGATNPSKLELEFFYNNLVEPGNSTFGLIQKFDFNDKSNIQLVCKDQKIITDGVVVRGLYSTITLGCYGHHVDHVEVASAAEAKEATPKTETAKTEEVSPSAITEVVSAPEKKLEGTKSPVVVDEQESEAEGKAVPPEVKPAEAMELDAPQAIPTITTRVNFVPMGMIGNSKADRKSTELSDLNETGEEYDSKAIASAVPVSASPSPIMETEDISDGEVPSTDDDLENGLGSQSHRSANSVGGKSPSVHSRSDSAVPPERPSSRPGSHTGSHKTSLDTISPNRDQLSEPDEADEFQDRAFEVEEILSDEEMPDFDSEMSEWRAYLANKSIRIFDPYSENFVVMPLQNFSVDSHVLKVLGKTTMPQDVALEKVMNAADRFSAQNFHSQNLEGWVEILENLNHFIPEVLSNLPDGIKKDSLLETLFYWGRKGLDIRLASSQAALPFKVRHIKAGIRLVQNLAMSGRKVNEKLLAYPFSDENESCQAVLLSLLMAKNVGISSQLLIFRALDSTLDSKLGYQKFVSEQSVGGMTPFQKLVEYSVETKFTVRVTFALRSLLTKVKLMECIGTLDFLVGQLITRNVSLDSSNVIEELKNCMQFIVNVAVKADQLLAHPPRMFPVSYLLEMPPNSYGLDPSSSFVKALEEMRFMKICAVLLCWREVPVEVVSMICDLFSAILGWDVGIVYLCNEGESTWAALRALLAWEEEGSGTTAIYAAHCVEIMRCLDLVAEASKVGSLEDDEDVRSLQSLFGFMMTAVGRKALVDVLSLGNNLSYITKCIAPTEAEIGFLHMNRNERSARKGYAMDVLHSVVKHSDSFSFLHQHGADLHRFITSLREEGDSCDKLTDLLPFLKPCLNPLHFSYGGIESVCETVKAKALTLFQCNGPEDNWGIPPELITGVRILASLGVASSEDDNLRAWTTGDPEMEIKELKYEMSLVKIHSMDVAACFIKVLQRICEEFSQPALHAYTLMGSRGDALISLVLPLTKLLRAVMTHVIQTRGTDFRDVSAIPALLQMHALMSCFPQSSLNQSKVMEINQNIIATLLAYTVPALKQGEETEEELNKSAWTALISETLKFTLTAPHAFVPGLTILSELLPLPLPMSARHPLDETECLEGIKLRKLWSAYLHGLSPQIQEMIGILCGSTHGRLLSVLKRVCLQLADLAPSTCLVVVRAILDSVMTSIESDFERQAAEESSNPASSVKAWVETAHGRALIQCSAQSARLLGFLSTLVSNAAVIKGGLLQAIRSFSKTEDKCSDFLSLMCSVIASKPSQSSSIYHVQAQDHIVSIFQSLCDAQNNILLPLFGRSEQTVDPDVMLANALPQRDSLNLICSSLMGYLNTLEDRITTNGHVVEGVIRTFAILAETEYGFYHLRTVLEKYPRALFHLTRVISTSEMENFEMGETLWPCINYLLEFLKSLITPKQNESSNGLPPRLSVMRPDELKKCIGWSLAEPSQHQAIVPNTSVVEDSGETEGISIKKEEEGIAEESVKTNATADGTAEPEAMETDEPDDHIKPEFKDVKTEECSVKVHPLVQLKSLLEKYMHSNEGEEQQGPLITLSNYDPYDLLQICESILNYIEEDKIDGRQQSFPPPAEVVLPQPDLLADVYAQRSVFVLLDKLNLDSLPNYWLTSVPPSFDLDVETSEADLIPCDLNTLSKTLTDVDLAEQVEVLLKNSVKTAEVKNVNNNQLNPNALGVHQMRKGNSLLGMPPRKMPFNTSMRGQNRSGFGRGLLPGPGRMGNVVFDPFRSRPPNTSRPPSLHVDDFVALETSGHNQTGISPYNKGGMIRSNNDPFVGRPRGSPRGSGVLRPYNSGPGGDRGRPFRSNPSVPPYYNPSRMDGNMPRGRYISPRGRGYIPGDRWSNDNRNSVSSSSSPYGRQLDHMSRSSGYDDKFRSASIAPGGVTRSSTSQSSRQPYSRPPYREAPAHRTSTTMSNVPSQRWRDKPRPFQR